MTAPVGPMNRAAGAGDGAVRARGGMLVSAAAALCAVGAATVQIVDLLHGLDPRWAVAANLLLFPPAAVLAWLAQRIAGAAAAMAAAGLVVGPVGALLGDRAGHTWWWLALETVWWAGVMLAFWRSRPGLSVVSGAAAVSVLVAVLFVGLSLPEPVASAAGLRVPLTIAWSAWVAVDLAARPISAARDQRVEPA
jgi:hypothetical protein